MNTDKTRVQKVHPSAHVVPAMVDGKVEWRVVDCIRIPLGETGPTELGAWQNAYAALKSQDKELAGMLRSKKEELEGRLLKAATDRAGSCTHPQKDLRLNRFPHCRKLWGERIDHYCINCLAALYTEFMTKYPLLKE